MPVSPLSTVDVTSPTILPYFLVLRIVKARRRPLSRQCCVISLIFVNSNRIASFRSSRLIILSIFSNRSSLWFSYFFRFPSFFVYFVLCHLFATMTEIVFALAGKRAMAFSYSEHIRYIRLPIIYFQFVIEIEIVCAGRMTISNSMRNRFVAQFLFRSDFLSPNWAVCIDDSVDDIADNQMIKFSVTRVSFLFSLEWKMNGIATNRKQRQYDADDVDDDSNKIRMCFVNFIARNLFPWK